MVTFVLSSLNTNSPGGGRKSFTSRVLPIGSSVYSIFFFINSFTFPPITCAKYSNVISSVCKSYRQDFVVYFSKTIKTFFMSTMLKVFMNNSIRVEKSKLRLIKRNAMFQLIFNVLDRIPFKAFPAHEMMLVQSHINSNI